MSVDELTIVHRRYIDSSERFRAAWAYQQFITSLHKVLLDGDAAQPPLDFTQLHAELKEISQHLNASATDYVRERLDKVDQRLSRVMAAMLAEDSRIDPASLRHFFQRVRSTNDRVLGQLVKFYLYAHDGATWPETRLDKVDFLLTRIASLDQGDGAGSVSGQRDTTRELLRGLWGIVGQPAPSDSAVEQQLRLIASIRTEMAQVKDLDELARREVVTRYRQIKHGLGPQLLFPDLLFAVLDANLKLAQRVQGLYKDEEKRLTDDYQRIFELGRNALFDDQLDSELAEFRQQIDSFESRLKNEELSLDDLAQIRRRMRSLMPRLAPVVGGPQSAGPRSAPLQGSGSGSAGSRPAVSRTPEAGPAAGFVAEAQLAAIRSALSGVGLEDDERVAVLRPELFALRLEPREVSAHRRLAAGRAREVEPFLLESAAIRSLMNEQVVEIRGLLDDTSTSGEAPIFATARATARAADRLLRQFEHYLEQAVADGDLDEARDLQLLRMRLMRDYSGLWLLAHRPLRSS